MGRLTSGRVASVLSFRKMRNDIGSGVHGKLQRQPLQASRGATMIEGTCHCRAVRWTFKGRPASATACNCTVCRRYGALWAADFEDERIGVSGETLNYVRGDRTQGFHFCGRCGCVAYWRGLVTSTIGNRRRMAVNLRLATPSSVGKIIVDHFDGLKSFDDLPRDGRCVADLWF